MFFKNKKMFYVDDDDCVYLFTIQWDNINIFFIQVKKIHIIYKSKIISVAFQTNTIYLMKNIKI